MEMEARAKLGACTNSEHGHVRAGTIVWVEREDGRMPRGKLVPALLEEGIDEDLLPYTLGRVVFVDADELLSYSGENTWLENRWLHSFADIARMTAQPAVPLVRDGEQIGCEVSFEPGEKPRCEVCG